MKRTLVLLLVAGMLLACSCASSPAQTQAGLVTQDGVPSSAVSSSAPASSSAASSVSQGPAVSSSCAQIPPPVTAAPVVSTGFIHPLTGLPVSEELLGKRPVAVMINNIKASMPQVGIGSADILYECLAEGGITRLLALYLDYESVGTIGSVRSSRDYYLDLAQIHDAIYIHAGGSEIAYSQIASRGIQNLDGVRTTVSGVFWRDPDRLQTMSREHTMVTSGAKIAMGIAKKNYRTEYTDGFQSSYRFYESATELNGAEASYVKIPNSSSYVAEMFYDADTKLYRKNQFGKPHVDGATGEQLAFTNVLILYARQRTVDDYGRLEVELTGSGKGYYCTGGKAVEITWNRSDRDGGITLLNTDGSPLRLNPGKSYVSIASDKIYNKTVIE